MGIRVGDLYGLPFPSIDVTVSMNSGEIWMELDKHPIFTENMLRLQRKLQREEFKSKGITEQSLGRSLG